MATLIDGKNLAKRLNEMTAQRVEKLRTSHDIVPGLVVIIVGADQASQRYVRNKHRTAQKLGINSTIKELSSDVSQEELLTLIRQFNDDKTVNGILVQDPLPNQIDEKLVTKTIAPEKDVDGFHPENVGKLYLNDNSNYPVACTPKGIMTMFSEYNIDLMGKDVVMIGRSAIVGKPMAALMLNAGASVTIVHRHSKDVASYTKNADVIVSATGHLHTVTADDVKPGAVVIDVGQNMNEDGHLVGDVDFDDVEPKASFITPVPGGVGPMTIATLMQQTVDLTEWSLLRE
ncbi:bifunctional 5,10-methylenetetrahydrofolate dehydrogenase/5,10-methenyltetrahydrofolate cyclohydrolase [Lentilactobacillus sp. SPB1-3]|uniref:Bifunctional 5,10-methylenetetrahydrofolate dehydrogenase/5,10-methenyltetrahydrofolate cyclohydrolase n=1 Tax=Lentilactobacillus terminaliae TaxID=3003483 RepID=A0ACD5DBW2_9LACO|nr:tetrahydrofolate dehydrogenase/cyclohydrolase catalytic domain-containing protein [Lentilactobacillus sp. SPB1-3]MCZ0977155.1 bifunctional methylenetetrahydrofolate dehydrogenase/methenyltetrahydrofolate cyclohydrolase [Lentilactobacillus sp. SPB1-3]